VTRTRSWERVEALVGWAMVAPAGLLLAFWVLGPSVAVVVLSLSDWQLGASTLRWVGAANYAQLLADRVFWRSLANTLVYAGVVVPLSVGIGLAFAILIESGRSLRTFYRAVFFLPVTATLIAMAVVWEFILHPSVGLLNLALDAIGVRGTDWLKDPSAALLTICAIGVWQAVGFNVVLFLAGLTAIPGALYEAAAVDGADSAWERFRVVTWPLLAPMTTFVLIVTAIRSFQVFDTVEVLTKGGPSKATEVLLYTMYTEGFSFFRTGYACAVTVVFLALVLALTLLQARLRERRPAAW
jgi:multiple sugar transport system permease protein